ncbi:unnamed protein product [Ambrosiozyma monospora]|uniref:Unnamed protein product n=1 Tax=Ambrosiozyma monospora TaxID=43982 RepID=A0ACB5T0B2_AMBMO|nr:unnamed protein product [Ambrosiozyma monospora]
MSAAAVSTQTLKLKAEVPLDKEIESIIKSGKAKRASNYQKAVYGPDPEGLKILPEGARLRLFESGVDISKGYPAKPNAEVIPVYLDEAYAIRNEEYPYVERGKNADPEKKALFSAATAVIPLTKHVGTELVGIQLADLNDKQKDELALLIAERIVVVFKDQKLSHQKQLELGEYWGQVEKHPQTIQVPGLPGITTIWVDYSRSKGNSVSFKNVDLGNWDPKYNGGASTTTHTDLVHEKQPAGLTSLHHDSSPDVGGDTLFYSGYAAYDKLSEEFKKFLDGKKAVYVSAHGYLDRDDPFAGPKKIERIHPLVRTHPATGWKFLFVNRSMTKRILGVSPVESDIILKYLFDIYEKNADIQARVKWGPIKLGYGTTAIWDNRVSQHRTTWDHEAKSTSRHGTRVTALAEIPYFDPNSKSQREALGLPLDE